MNALAYGQSHSRSNALLRKIPKERMATVGLDIPEVVKKFELAGGSIINAVHYASLKAVERQGKMVAFILIPLGMEINVYEPTVIWSSV